MSQGQNQHFAGPDKFGELLGYERKIFDRTKCLASITLTVDDRHLSPTGKAHGGVISTLLDAACGLAMLTTLDNREVCSTVEIKVNYFKLVASGDHLEAFAEVVFRGNKLCALQARLMRGDEPEPVAIASATFHVVARDR